MACSNQEMHSANFVPVCASVICEAPGVIYVSIDPEVWKIRCRQCQEKTDHKCALKKLKAKFRPSFLSDKRKDSKSKEDKNKKVQEGWEGDEYENEEEDDEERKHNREEEEEEEEEWEGGGRKKREAVERKEQGQDDKEKNKKLLESLLAHEITKRSAMKGSLDLNPPPPLPDNFCACADRPTDVVPRPNVCSCEIYKPLNFMFELEVTGEYKPAYVPKARKGKE